MYGHTNPSVVTELEHTTHAEERVTPVHLFVYLYTQAFNKKYDKSPLRLCCEKITTGRDLDWGEGTDRII